MHARILFVAALSAITFVAHAPGQAVAEAAHGSTRPVLRTISPPTLPQAITSFGACRSGATAWIFGGHIGKEHAHSRANVVGTFLRLNLADGAEWQLLPSGPAVQGTALVAGPDGAPWRIGGMSAHNEPGADADLHSTASVARFDIGSSTWRETTPLPEARSSHDATVLGNDVYVVGGWNLNGTEDGTWHTTAWRADLRIEPLAWQPVPPPSHPRRAAALATLGGKLVLLGGLGDDGMLATVEVLDPATGTWTRGPDLPGQAFGTAAVEVGGALFATVADGRLLRWNGTGDWIVVNQMATPRFFHRLLTTPDADRLMALGGAGRGGHTRTAEWVHLGPSSDPVLEEVVLPAPDRVAMRQAFQLRDEVLWSFGGNRGGGDDRFASDRFADDIWRIDLATRTATRVADLPVAVQSMAVAAGADRTSYLVGGLGVSATGDGTAVRSLTTTWRWDERGRRLVAFAPLPEPRTQCQTLFHRDRLWVFGGTDFVPDADGGTQQGDMTQVFVCDPQAAEPIFSVADLRLPHARRSFGVGRIDDEVFLIGGLGEGFTPTPIGDVYDFATGKWRQLEQPLPWVSPQVAVVGERLYVACGGTMHGQRFTADRALWSWHAREGWRQVIAELPFATRRTQMLGHRNRLLFVATDDPRGDRIVLRWITPDPSVAVPESAMRH